MPEKAVTVTAKFEKIPEKYDITFKAVDEEKNEIKQTIDAMPVNGKYEFGKEITLPTDLSVKGYKFIGWEVEGKTLADSKFVVPSKDTTVFAKFEKLKSYRVTYKIKESMYYVVNVTLPQSKFCLAYETFNIEIPEATGFNCKYKVTDSKNNIIDSTNGKFIMPESNVTIELNYVKNKYLATQCAVDEDGNDISKIVGINAKVYYEYDTIVSLNTMMDFTKYSYKFLGWEVKTVDGEIVPINENGKFKVPAKDILLIAKAAKLKQSYIEFIFYDNLQGNGTSDKNYPKVTGHLEMSKFPYTVAGIKKIAENHLENAKD
ncbi:MAG: InlB B-repeat-containing protein, partial [Oscillospiraceae bacterium]